MTVTLPASSQAGSDNCPLLRTSSDHENRASWTLVSIQRRSEGNALW